MRGEYLIHSMLDLAVEELPPRARRILVQGFDLLVRVGTTSACAENTNTRLEQLSAIGNYLRVRGEYRRRRRTRPANGELPPRARRIRDSLTDPKTPAGTTSACAENTECKDPRDTNTWNYLRVRGEYPVVA